MLLVAAVLLPTRSPVVSALSGETLPGVRIELSPAYLALAPVLGLWDALAVLSIPQHLAMLGGWIALFLLWRVARARAAARGAGVTVPREALLVLAFVLGVLVFYGIGAVVPRPMAALRVADPDVLVVDFHSHTGTSHDGRESFTGEVNRAWHRGAGYHVAYITDHDSVNAAQDAAARNPARAGNGTVILVGREVIYRGQHVAVLGTLDPRAIQMADGDSAVAGPDGSCPAWPVLIQTIPENLTVVPVAECPDGAGGLHAIELIDGAPRGIGQGDRDRALLFTLADSLDLALVASSNLHGWARTASGWNLLRIPGWRDLTPDQVGRAIEQKILRERRAAVEVVGWRRPVDAAVGPALLGLPIRFVVDYVSQLSRGERISWLLWLAALAALGGRARAAAPGRAGTPAREEALTATASA